MNTSINSASQIYLAELWGKIVGFIGVIHFPHPRVKNIKKVTRVVVLPDYQGIGIGSMLLNFVGELYTSKGYRLTITTSHPSINKSFAKSKDKWKLLRQGRVEPGLHKSANKGITKTNTRKRLTCSWEYIINLKTKLNDK